MNMPDNITTLSAEEVRTDTYIFVGGLKFRVVATKQTGSIMLIFGENRPFGTMQMEVQAGTPIMVASD